MTKQNLPVNSISQIYEALALPKPKHPLVTVINAEDFETDTDFSDVRIIMNLYQISMKQGQLGVLRYGRNSYDYEEGSLIFTAPGQVLEYENFDDLNAPHPLGWSLFFHPDLIRKSELGDNIERYNFFSYDANEALHVSEAESNMIEEILSKIVKEYSQNLDKHSQHLIIANIQLLLDYCVRYYDRQFITRSNLNSDIISKFDRLLKSYFQTSKVQDQGIPSVSYTANELNLSTNYLSDLLKKETGKTAQEHIHLFVIEKAKNSLLNSNSSVSEIAYNLGFEYPQHFSSLFKSKTGKSPREYRTLN